MKKKILLFTLPLVLIIAAVTAAGVWHHDHQYDSTVFTGNFKSTNHQKWWYGHDQAAVNAAYGEAEKQISTVSLEKFYTGQTVYFTKDNRPFVISGTKIVYLQRSGQKLCLADKDNADIRCEKTGQKLAVGTQAQADALTSRLKQAQKAMSGKNKQTALIVNGRLTGKPVTVKEDGKGNLLLDTSSLLPESGVSCTAGKSAVRFSFADTAGKIHTFAIPVAALAHQPWTDPATQNTFPAISRTNGRYYIAQNILVQCFGFDVTWNKADNYVSVITDTADVAKPVAQTDYTLDTRYVVPAAQARQLGVLDDNGVLKDDAVSIYQASIAAAARAASSTTAAASAPKQPSSKAPSISTAPEPAGFRGAAFNGVSQVITVTSNGMHTPYATTNVYEKSGDTWNTVLSNIGTLIGQNGMVYASQRMQETNTTPAGLFDFVFAFGWAGNPGTKMSYRQSDGNSYWDENSGSPTYNRWVEGNPGGECEQLQTEPLYKYALVINYNWNQAPGKGAGIFLHIRPGHYTGGCVGIDEGSLVKILQWIDPAKNPKILIIPQNDLSKYYY